MSAYYNENDKFAAAWLRELIKAGQIADGDVDERSIEDVKPTELKGYSQCHFFAGIGGWSYALRQAGWGDDRPVWTGSCPCQSFSTAGKRAGFDDKRHLWPVWFELIKECRPNTIFGEQVEAAIRYGWLDTVQADLEGCDYAVGAVVLPACGFGAPHRRQRLYFVAESECTGAGRNAGDALRTETEGSSKRCQDGLYSSNALITDSSVRGPLADATRERNNGSRTAGQDGRPEYSNGSESFWSRCEWVWCRDGKYRSVESATERLADGISDDMGLVRYENYLNSEDAAYIYAPLIQGGKARVGRLRGYGNAIVAPVAAAFIRAYMESAK